MATAFLAQEWVATALIDFKNETFREDFVTTAELNQFVYFLNEYFKKEKLDILVTHALPNNEDFNIRNGVITISNRLNIDLLSEEYVNILYDNQLISEFFLNIENNKIESLENTIYKSNCYTKTNKSKI